ncbi:MAG: glycosyltransferase family 39 protein [Butyrivibrio sp.]|nr:glycosyltransferase family 39 protein [Butyrivibrio sp.]
MKKHLTNLITIIYHIMMLTIIVVLIFANIIPYNEFHKRVFLLPNIFLLFMGVAAFLGLRVLVKKMSITKKNTRNLIAVMFIAPMIVAFGAAFMTGWDAWDVSHDAFKLAQGGRINPDYYSMYPNNRLILIIVTTIAKLGIQFGLYETSSLYMLVVFVQSILFGVTGLLVYDYFRMESDSKTAIIGGIIYTIFISISPWGYIVYTDAIGIIFPVLILWLFRKINAKQWWLQFLKWCLILVVAVIGYNVKAPVFIMFIATFLSHIISILSDFKLKKMLSGLALLMLVGVLGIELMKAGDKVVDRVFESITGVQRNEEMAVTPYYYLMMGHNYDRDGTVNNDDMTFSMYIQDYSERISQNKAKFKERIKEMWPYKLIYLYIRKLTMNYNDGSFGYGLGGEDFISEKLFDDTVINAGIRYFYWPGRNGFTIYLNVIQIFWLGILFFCMLFKPKNENGLTCCIAIMGITIFTLLFEAQARYLFVMAPVYVIEAGITLMDLCENTNGGGKLYEFFRPIIGAIR